MFWATSFDQLLPSASDDKVKSGHSGPASASIQPVLQVRVLVRSQPHLLPEATPQDLSKYIIKDGDYPVARSGCGEIWKYTFHINHNSVKVYLPSFVCLSV